MDGDCSLREAIIAANLDQAVDDCPAGNGTDIIDLPAGTYVLTIAGKNENAAHTGDLDLNSDLTIKGAGRAMTIIDADHLDRVLDISGGHTVQISGVGITGGRLTANIGGGILIDNGSTLNLSNSRVTGNGAANGGGGFYVNNSTLTVISSRVDHNITSVDGGGFHINNSTLTLTNSRVDHNEANAGGGMYVTGSILTLANSRIDSNTGNYIGGGIGINDSTMTVTNSHIDGNSGGYSGGGIDASTGTMTLTDSRIYSNTVIGTGGGIFLTLGTMTITNTQISSNISSTNTGGGISTGGILTLVNSTISGNHAASSGGGLDVRIHTAQLFNVTIANNTADSDGDDDGNGGGVYITPTDGLFTATHTIISGNIDNSSSADQHPDCSGLLIGEGYNLIEDTTGCTLGGDTTGTITGTSPNLGPLQDNGGDTLTHALLTGSPAIDAGNPAGCLDQADLSLTTDQRNYIRPADGGSGSARCDMGAYEFNSPGPASPADHVVYLPLVQK